MLLNEHSVMHKIHDVVSLCCFSFHHDRSLNFFLNFNELLATKTRAAEPVS